MPRKRAKPRRRPAARCGYSPRCKGRPNVIVSDTERLCGRHATWAADKLVGDFVRNRDGRCVLASFAPTTPCYQGDTLYWCHLIPKGRYSATRYDPENAVAGCAAHHKAFDEAPLEKARWIVRHLGRDEFDALEHRAMHGTKPEIGAVIRLFRGDDAA